MHDTSYNYVKYFADRHVKPPCSVVDVGSFAVENQNTFRPIFTGCDYTGIDIVPGRNVDRVVEMYAYGDQQYDFVISGNAMEHVQDLHAWKNAVVSICKPNGLICITVPHSWPEHKHPLDCWRVFPDGMRWLFRDLKILECRRNDHDTLFIARNCDPASTEIQELPEGPIPKPVPVHIRRARHPRH
jgi:SAM-dependent methyltransferase